MDSPRKKRVLFVCFGNASRSQMAEAFARMHGGEHIEAFSAGVRPSRAIDEQAVTAMAERGYDLRTHRPKGLTELPHQEYDVLVTMGCEVECPMVAATTRVEWNLPQAKGLAPAEFRALTETIDQRVQALLTEIGAGPDGRGNLEGSEP